MPFRMFMAGLAALGLLAFGARAHAFVHIVHKGETLASIAELYYGRIQHEKLLVAANGLDAQGGSPIVAGMRLEIPAVSHHRVREEDSWESMAERLLGEKDRADVLALANDTNPWIPPRIGAIIVVPYNLTIIATGDETLLGLAYKYLGNRNKAWVINRYNDLQGRKIRRGDVLLIALSDLPLTKAGRAAARATARIQCTQADAPALATQKSVQSELPAFIADVRSGRYVSAVARGSRFLASGELTRQQLALIHRYLLESYAALGATGMATASCHAWRKADPDARLDPKRLSPKLMAACRVQQSSDD